LPKVSEFFGIAIYVYWREHGPPHFHAVYGEHEASIAIGNLAVVSGYLPPRALGLVLEWASLRQRELKEAWADAAEMKPIRKIDPLG
jgi:hypothetical protein